MSQDYSVISKEVVGNSWDILNVILGHKYHSNQSNGFIFNEWSQNLQRKWVLLQSVKGELSVLYFCHSLCGDLAEAGNSCGLVQSHPLHPLSLFKGLLLRAGVRILISFRDMTLVYIIWLWSSDHAHAYPLLIGLSRSCFLPQPNPGQR